MWNSRSVCFTAGGPPVDRSGRIQEPEAEGIIWTEALWADTATCARPQRPRRIGTRDHTAIGRTVATWRGTRAPTAYAGGPTRGCGRGVRLGRGPTGGSGPRRAVPKCWRADEGAGHGVVTMSMRAATNGSRLPLSTDDLASHRREPEPRCAASLPPSVSSSRRRWPAVRGCCWRSGWSGCRTRAIAGVCATRSWRCCRSPPRLRQPAHARIRRSGSGARNAPQQTLARLGAYLLTSLNVRIAPSGSTVRKIAPTVCPGGLADLTGETPAGAESVAADGKSARGSRHGQSQPRTCSLP